MPSEIQFAKCPLVHWIISDEELQSFDSLKAFVIAIAQLMVAVQVVFGYHGRAGGPVVAAGGGP